MSWNGTRLDILILLLDKGELPVGEIASQLNRKVNTASRNLGILEKDNFVVARHTSSNVFYSIKEDPRYKYNQDIFVILRKRLEEIKSRDFHIS